MNNFDTASVKADLGTNFTSTQIRSFASDCGSNILTAFTSRWTCASKQQTGITNMDSDFKAALILNLNKFADKIDAGITRDVSGVSITNSSGSGTAAGVKWTVHFNVDIVYFPLPVPVVVSMWFTSDTHA